MQLFNFVFVLFLVGVHCCGDYYWRDYDGRIPADAIPAGKHSETGLSYIGLAYIHNYGLYYGTIVPGKMEVSVPCWGVKKTDVIIKILCAPDPSKYYWIQTTSGSYSNDISDKCPIEGAYDRNNRPLGTLHLGRINLSGNTIVGGITYYNPSDPWFFYPENLDERNTRTFEALVKSK